MRREFVNAIGWAAVACTLYLLYSLAASGNVVHWEDSNKAFFGCITNADEHEHLDPITKSTLCMIVDQTSLGSVTITNSCFRKKSYHHGPSCSAADFYFDDYQGKSVEQMALEYFDNLYTMTAFLETVPFLLDRMGIGVYLPYKNSNGKWSSNGLIHHIDSRGEKARWSRIRGRKYNSLSAGIDLFLKDLGENHPDAEELSEISSSLSIP